MSMNFIGLSGRLTTAPELKTTTSGVTVCTTRIAVDRGYGEKKETDFFTIVLWNKQAETLCRYCSKGDKVTIIGKLQTRSYELKNGEKRTVYEIRVDELDLPPKNAAKQAEPEFSQPSMDDMMGTDDFPFC